MHGSRQRVRGCHGTIILEVGSGSQTTDPSQFQTADASRVANVVGQQLWAALGTMRRPRARGFQQKTRPVTGEVHRRGLKGMWFFPCASAMLAQNLPRKIENDQNIKTPIPKNTPVHAARNHAPPLSVLLIRACLCLESRVCPLSFSCAALPPLGQQKTRAPQVENAFMALA